MHYLVIFLLVAHQLEMIAIRILRSACFEFLVFEASYFMITTLLPPAIISENKKFIKD